MAEPKGFLIVPVGFNPDDDVRAITLDANDYLNVVLAAGLTGGGMGAPKGNLATVVGFNPDGDVRALELDANDNLLVTLLGGAAWNILRSDGTDAEWDDINDVLDAVARQGARVYNSIPLTIANVTSTTLTFDSESWDNDDIHSTLANTDRLTCKTAGKYLVACSLRWNGAAAGVRQAWFTINGVTVFAQDKRPHVGASALEVTVSAVYELAVNDYICLYVYQNSGAPLDMRASSDMSPIFSMQRVG